MESDGLVALAVAVGLPVWLAVEEIIHRFRALRARRSPVRASRRVLVQPRVA